MGGHVGHGGIYVESVAGFHMGTLAALAPHTAPRCPALSAAPALSPSVPSAMLVALPAMATLPPTSSLS